MKVLTVIWWLLIIRVLLFRLHYNYRAYRVRGWHRYNYQKVILEFMGIGYDEYALAFKNGNYTVTIQIVTYNEQELLAKCVLACVKLKYPLELLEIQVLDNSTDGSSSRNRQICEDVNTFLEHDLVKYIERDNKGFKSGALYEGMSLASGKYLAILDVDFVPHELWLVGMMCNFLHYEDTHKYFLQRLGMVQGRWTYANKHKNVITMGADALMTSYFRIEKLYQSIRGEFVVFNGSGAVWDKECILNSGNWDPKTVLSLDLELSSRVNRQKWHTIYIDDVSCITQGLVPETWKAFIGQQARWVWSGSWLTFHQPLKLSNRYLTWTTLKLLQWILLAGCLFIREPYMLFASLVAGIPNVVEVLYFKKAVGWKGWFAAITVGIFSLVDESHAVVRGMFNKPSFFKKTPKSKEDVERSNASTPYFSTAMFLLDVLFVLLLIDSVTNRMLALPLVFLTLVIAVSKWSTRYVT